MVNNRNGGLTAFWLTWMYGYVERMVTISVVICLPSRSMDETGLRTYFTEVDKNHYRIKEDLRKIVTFKQWNLTDALNVSSRFDLIFCRNVLIYFDQERKALVYDCLARLINNYGYLGIGGSESALHITDKWQQRRVGGTTFLQKVY